MTTDDETIGAKEHWLDWNLKLNFRLWKSTRNYVTSFLLCLPRRISTILFYMLIPFRMRMITALHNLRSLVAVITQAILLFLFVLALQSIPLSSLLAVSPCFSCLTKLFYYSISPHFYIRCVLKKCEYLCVRTRAVTRIYLYIQKAFIFIGLVSTSSLLDRWRLRQRVIWTAHILLFGFWNWFKGSLTGNLKKNLSSFLVSLPNVKVQTNLTLGIEPETTAILFIFRFSVFVIQFFFKAVKSLTFCFASIPPHFFIIWNKAVKRTWHLGLNLVHRNVR